RRALVGARLAGEVAAAAGQGRAAHRRQPLAAHDPRRRHAALRPATAPLAGPAVRTSLPALPRPARATVPGADAAPAGARRTTPPPPCGGRKPGSDLRPRPPVRRVLLPAQRPRARPPRPADAGDTRRRAGAVFPPVFHGGAAGHAELALPAD